MAYSAEPMSINEVLTVNRLRQWRVERLNIRHGRTAQYTNPGRPKAQAKSSRFDAAIVRVIDFERALGQLDQLEQSILVLCCCDGHGQQHAAMMLSMSARTLAYKLPSARRKLASILDRLDLL